MKPATTEDVLEMLDGYIAAAVVGAAMELGLFWLLDEQALPAPGVARALNIPLNRCHTWLQLLCKLGLLEEGAAGYAPSSTARRTILEAQSRHFWAFHARQDRYGYQSVRDLAVNIARPLPEWGAPDPAPGDDYQRVRDDATCAAEFTRMLYEIHLPLAAQVAGLLDLSGVKRLLDVGGGSGVVSLALLRKQPELTAVVVDVETVCRAGRQIAAENGLGDRVDYLAADFLEDELPAGFDMVLLCDLSCFSPVLFEKAHRALNENGRLVVVDKFAPDPSHAAPSRLAGAFLAALEQPAASVDLATAGAVQARLRAAGFRDLATTPVPRADNLRWNIDWTLLEART